jgi:pimeloyl-ACP methyl ester carboxylesterase
MNADALVRPRREGGFVKRLVLTTAAVSLGLGGLALAVPAGAQGAPATASAKSGIAWAKCPADNPYLANAECAQVQVPLDYRKPGGKKISIAISRVKHTVPDSQYQGVLLGNPGGPGGSGLYLSGGLANWLAPETAAKYDIIGFDPRGVGSSQPALTCDPHFADPVRPDYVPSSAKEEAAWLAKSVKYAKACQQKFGWLLPYLRTTDVARDVDGIRAALGVDKISYYGFSYGTYLGATYSTLFPKRVNRMVLDGNVDVRGVWYDAQLEQDKAFERNIKLYFAWIAKYDSVYHLGKTGAAVEKAYYKLLAQVKQKPLAGRVGPAELTDTMLNAGYTVFWYERQAEALADYINNGKADKLVALYDDYIASPDDNGFAIYLAVQGVDAKWPRDWRTWHNDAVKLYQAGVKFETWGNVWFNAPIVAWPVKGGPALKINGKGMAPALLVQSTLDAATPYPGGVEMHKLLPSRLIAEVGGKTHANTLNGNACLDDKVNAYLATGVLPADRPGNGPDVTCGALPDPDPTAARTMATSPRADVVFGRP